MTIWETTAAALASLDIAMGADSYISTTLPDQYIVYSLVDGVPAQHADDAELSREYRVQISFYSRGGLQDADLTAITAAMTAAGFRPRTRHPPTLHTSDPAFWPGAGLLLFERGLKWRL